jgi:hypothetical protein
MQKPGVRAHIRIVPWPPERAREQFLGSWNTFAHMAKLPVRGHA